jgi:crotonobetainyl-CoA:carnitine CoA-transferase CaiB-like acyl-CoA transferase
MWIYPHCEYWIVLFDANEIPYGPINNYEQVFADPQIVSREMAVEIEHPTLGRMKSLRRRSH